MLKFTLFLMMLHAFPETHLSNAQSDRVYWLVTAPAKLRVTRGSCVVIPCSYTLPSNAPAVSIYKGLWKKLPEQATVAHSSGNLPHQDYRMRTRFLGSMHKQNCTVMLWDVRDSDAGLYFFRIEMPEYDNYSWSYQPTELQVVGEDDTVVEVEYGGAGVDALAYCSLIYTCRENPPSLTWNINGTALRGTSWKDDWQWLSYSVLHFSPQQDTTLKPRCTVAYHG